MDIAKEITPLLVLSPLVPIAHAQSMADGLGDLAVEKAYRLKRILSYDRSRANAGYRFIEPGPTLTLLDEEVPAKSPTFGSISILRRSTTSRSWSCECTGITNRTRLLKLPLVISLVSATGTRRRESR